MATIFSEADVRGMCGEQSDKFSQEVIATIIALSKFTPLLAPLIVHCAIQSLEPDDQVSKEVVAETAQTFLSLYSESLKICLDPEEMRQLDFDTIIYCLVLGQNSLILTRCIIANVIASTPDDQSTDFSAMLVAGVTHASSLQPNQHI